MALPAFMYGDPADVIEREEGKTCKGCRHEEKHRAFGEVVAICTKGKKHGQRCRLYQATEDRR